jgi:hypothetical protein
LVALPLGLLALTPRCDSLALLATLVVAAIEVFGVVHLAVAGWDGGTTEDDAPEGRVEPARTSSNI